MQRTIVIGDIHGCLDSLTALLQLVLPKADTLVFLGDYVDRGPASKEVITRLLELQQSHPRTIFIQGNHDYMFLQFLKKKETNPFIQVGGRETLISYSIELDDTVSTNTIPPEHFRFFSQLPLHFEDQHAIYVHAGLEPGRHLSQQRAAWCLWARNNFLQSNYNFGKPVIFGHTPFPTPHHTDTCIGIDTGAVYGGSLTALILPDMEFISVPGEQKKPFPRT